MNCDILWRTGRVALFLKLANSPVGSFQQLAFIVHHHLQSPWFLAALNDILTVLPGVTVVPTMVHADPFLSSSGAWSEEGEWLSLHARRLPTNLNGLRYFPKHPQEQSLLKQAVQRHVKHVVSLLRTSLLRNMWSQVYQNVLDTCSNTENSKLRLLAARLQSQGPPLHLALDAIALPQHRAAVASLFCADFFLAVHAKNYYAKQLLPWSPHHLTLVNDAAVDKSVVCLSCWQFRRQVSREDEYHLICVCPEYSRPRQELLSSLPEGRTLNTFTDVSWLLSGVDPLVMAALGRFCVRARQQRRQLRLLLERLNHKVETGSLIAKRAAWRLRRRPVCRHGVFFTALPPGGCKCLQATTTEADWENARLMPHLDEEIKAITAVAFDRERFERLGVLQARARQLGW